MGKILNLGFIAIIIAGISRYLISQKLGAPFFDIENYEEKELWLYGISIFWFLLAYWNTIIRRRCPKCKSVKYIFNGAEEVDRWVGSKKVREKVGKDTYANRSVPTTYVKMKKSFQCSACNNPWSETVKQEIN